MSPRPAFSMASEMPAVAGALSPATAESLTGRLCELLADLRSRGLRAGTGELMLAHRALAAVDPASRTQARLALRATICCSRSDWPAFEEAFAQWAGVAPPQGPQRPSAPEPAFVPPSLAWPAERSSEHGLDEERLEPQLVAFSDVELLREKDFAAYSEAERARAMALMRAIAARGPLRLSRRTKSTRRRSDRLDARGTLRAALRHAGEPVDRRWRAPTPRHRPLLLVCDISGSMAPYTRMLLQYAHACILARRRCEVFAFGTRLSRITVELRHRDPDRALARAAEAVSDWGGGTRIGDALAQLNRTYGQRIGRGAVVVMLSDGWDRGEPELLRDEIARLARCAHRLVWLNPLKANPGYEPITRGMLAALPSIDHLLAGNTLRSLEHLATLLGSSARR